MERRFAARMQEALDGAVVDPRVFRDVQPRLENFLETFVARWRELEQKEHARGYVTRIEQALVDVRLYLPESWASDKKRLKKAGVPKEVRFQTRHELALAMLDENGPLLPHSWVTGDDEMGRSTYFRRELQGRNERYLLMVPSNTLVRDLEAEPPPSGGRGPHPQVPFVRVDRWAAAQPSSAWTTIEIRPGEKGPLIVEAMKRRVSAKTDRRRAGTAEVLVVFRAKQA